MGSHLRPKLLYHSSTGFAMGVTVCDTILPSFSSFLQFSSLILILITFFHVRLLSTLPVQSGKREALLLQNTIRLPTIRIPPGIYTYSTVSPYSPLPLHITSHDNALLHWFELASQLDNSGSACSGFCFYFCCVVFFFFFFVFFS